MKLSYSDNVIYIILILILVIAIVFKYLCVYIFKCVNNINNAENKNEKKC